MQAVDGATLHGLTICPPMAAAAPIAAVAAGTQSVAMAGEPRPRSVIFDQRPLDVSASHGPDAPHQVPVGADDLEPAVAGPLVPWRPVSGEQATDPDPDRRDVCRVVPEAVGRHVWTVPLIEHSFESA
jgi:hypothetical protein